MSSRHNHMSSAFPAIPSSLNAGDHEMHNYHRNEQIAPPMPNTAPRLTPYIGLRGRLSQIWINRWTVLLLLVLVRMLLATRSLDDNLGSARREALSACTGVESMGSAMASMPHYMSQGVNELTASGVEKAVNGLMSMLSLSVTGVEELVVFVVNLLTSTYVCLITLAVSGSLHTALQVVEDVSDFLNKTLGEIGSGIHKGIDGFQDELNKFTDVLNSVPKIFGSDSKIPKLDIGGELDKLDNLHIPASLDQNLEKLNSSIPTFAEVQNFTNTALRLPFEQVKKLINESMVKYKFDRSVFPVPQKERLNFCSDNDGIDDFFKKLAALSNSARKIFIGVLLVAAILVCIPMAYREIRRWRTMQQRATLVREEGLDPMDVIHITSRPTSSTLGLKLASRFGSTRRQILVRWLVAYVTSTPALFLLSLGLAGLFACLCHYILLKAVEKETPALAKQVGEFAGKVVKILDRASQQWAIGTNSVIESTNNDINKEVFGWVNTTTGALNETLNAFVEHMSDALNVTFGGTILYDPIKEVLNCLIGLKIAGIQKGLTWVSDHAHIDFPRLANDTFSLGAAASIASDSKEASDSFLADPSSKATDKITDAVADMTAKIAQGIRTEAIISTCILLVWLAMVLIGLFRVSYLFLGRDKVRGDGGDDHQYDQHAMNTRDSGFYPPAAFRAPTAESAADHRSKQHDSRPGTWYSTHDKDVIGAGGREKVGFAGLRHGAAVMVGRAFDRKSSHAVMGEKV
ncbi:MAG: plasma membrane fusion protein prm1 [Peltula sp. TS41687]|nr:MAG: plasma membrane fusion protein prm1 [Peltula sp. TS41687]